MAHMVNHVLEQGRQANFTVRPRSLARLFPVQVTLFFFLDVSVVVVRSSSPLPVCCACRSFCVSHCLTCDHSLFGSRKMGAIPSLQNSEIKKFKNSKNDKKMKKCQKCENVKKCQKMSKKFKKMAKHDKNDLPKKNAKKRKNQNIKI